MTLRGSLVVQLSGSRDGCTEVVAASITPKETLPVVFACAEWGQLWRNKRIRVYCDNEAAVANLNSDRSKEPWSIYMIRCLFFIKAIYGL